MSRAARGRGLRGRLLAARLPAAALLAATLLAGCGRGAQGAGTGPLADPQANIGPRPDYTQMCAPSGLDSSPLCLSLTLGAIDHARAQEDLAPMRLPSDFGTLSVPEQLLVALDSERADRGLPPFVGLSVALDRDAAAGAAASALPADPGTAYGDVDTEWIGDTMNGLDTDYQWMYMDGRGQGLSCGGSGQACWADRHIVLDDFGAETLVMGAAVDPTGNRTRGDEGGPSLAMVLASTDSAGPLAYTWAQAQADMTHGTLQARFTLPLHMSATGIPDPPRTEPADPDYTRVCAASGTDDSSPCLQAILEAVDNARAREGVKPMRLPPGFGQLTVPEQILVSVDLERVDRGLAPFTGLTAALDTNAQKGADSANDPPDPGPAYQVDDGEWAGGAVNGLDAVYGWMYDDGPGSGNLDCPSAASPGCWGHREGILDSFGSVGTLVMGAAFDPTGDTSQGDVGGTSMAATLAVTRQPPGRLVFSWSDAEG